MTEQFTNFANVRVEDIPAGFSYSVRDGWGASYRSPEKIKSVNGVMEYHYILEWITHTPTSIVMIIEEYFGSEVVYSSYEFNQQQIVKVGYSGGDCYYVEKGQVRKETTQPAEQLNQGTEKAATIDEKLDAIIDRLDVLEVKLSGENGATPDKENPINQWQVKMVDDKNPGRAIPFYVGDYLHAEALTGEHIIVDGEEYLVMQDNLKRRYRVSRKTQIVHLMDYVRIFNVDAEPSIDGWRSSNGGVVVCGPEGVRTLLATGTKYKVLDLAVTNLTEGNPGIGLLTDHVVAVRYADYNYPTL